MFNFSYYESGNLAVFILTLMAGLIVSRLFKSGSLSGCISYILAIVVLVIVISAITRGYSYFIEDITFHLQQYIYFNGIGVFGFGLGLFIGLYFGRRK